MIEQMKEAARDWLGPSPNQPQPNALDPNATHLSAISLEYSYVDLQRATNCFAAANRLGAGAAGAVYKGTLRGGTEVAVKVLLDSSALGGFEDEVRVLSRFRHPNLVTLLGWGHSKGEKYLVYELLTGGDVSKRLENSKKGQGPFPWKERLRVAHDSARGFSYMVNSEPKAFHRDIKPPNIILDDGGGAKVADFGLASVIQDSRKHLTVEQISGTPGYACPMYIQTGRVNESSEVYSFGIVLLELLINQPPALSGPHGNIIYPLLEIVQPGTPGAHKRVLQNLDQQAGWPPDVVAEFADHAIRCVDMNPNRRPTFETVVKTLRNLCSKAQSISKPQAQSNSQPQAGIFGIQLPSPNIFGADGYWILGNGPADKPPPGYPGAAGHRSTTPPRGAPAGNSQRSTTPPRGAPAGNRTTTPPRGPPDQQLAEVILETVLADGVQLQSMSRAMKAIAFAVDPAKGRLSFVIGRQYQPEFFESLVQKQDNLHTVSRSHFEVSWEPPATAPTLRKLSSNPLFIDDQPVKANQAVTMRDGIRVGFARSENSDRFLVIRATLRSRGAVAKDGEHPAVIVTKRRSSTTSSGSGGNAPQASAASAMSTIKPGMAVAGALVCIYSVGGDPSNLPPESRAIALEDGVVTDIGRTHQPQNFFEHLLGGDLRWMNFISRSHCRVQLQRSASSCTLHVENLSNNAIIAKGRHLGKGLSQTLVENDKIVFVANPGGSEGDTRFLEFVLRRASC